MKREFLQNLKVGDQALSKEVIDAIMEENGKDIQLHKQAAQKWEGKYNQAVTDHEKALADMTFQNVLQAAIAGAKGRNAKAITALLDVEALRGSEDQQAAIEEALGALKKDSGYLFEEAQVPPPYARGTGSAAFAENNEPATLAGALREKFERK